MQAALVLLVIAGSTAWLAVDASKRDWTGNSFAKNVPSWVVGSLLLWIVIFPLYVFVHRKKAPLLAKPAAAPVPAVAMAASGPSEQYGPSLDDVEPEPEPQPEPEPEPEPTVEVVREAVVEIEPQPVLEPQPVVEPVSVAATAPLVEPEPDPVVELEAEADPVVEFALDPEPAVEIEHDSVVESGPEPASAPAPEPVLEISYPDVDEAPPGLSVDAFKDIKPVAFGGIVVEESEPAAPAPDPVVAPEPEAVVEVEPEPIIEPETVREFEPLSHPGVMDVPPLEPEPEPIFESEPEPAIAEPVADEAKPKKRGFRLPNPELKLPSFGRKSGSKGGLKLPSITLPANLQGPLSDVERKIVLGAAVAILAAGAFGYATAPSDDAGTVSPTPAPAAAAR